MSWTIWSLFATMELMLCLTPGPAVLFVLSSALRAGARRSIASNAGILAANAIYFVISATGVGALLAGSYRLFFLVKWAGAAYLIYLGARAMLGDWTITPGEEPMPARAPRLFGDGFLVQASNPKALIFFSALLPQFLDARHPIPAQVAILGVTSVIIEFFVLLGYGAAAGRISHLARQPRYAAWTNRIAGAMLAAAGAGLAALRK
ncbi:MAG TPA: LysE family translocator [Bryobacteraceae bacterium]|jgi:homoserine/homoserine lactone efflux protein|nr:LysE family translocator [Bryobacteraceae bacterium]